MYGDRGHPRLLIQKTAAPPLRSGAADGFSFLFSACHPAGDLNTGSGATARQPPRRNLVAPTPRRGPLPISPLRPRVSDHRPAAGRAASTLLCPSDDMRSSKVKSSDGFATGGSKKDRHDMSDQFKTRARDWAAAHQRQTFMAGKASLPSHLGQAPLFSRNFPHR